MTFANPASLSNFGFRSLAGLVLLGALFLGDKAQAQILYYVSETNVSSSAATILEFNFNPITNKATQVNSYATGVSGADGTSATADESYLSLSQGGTQLAYAGFNATNVSGSTEVLLTPSTGAIDKSTTPSGSVRSAYYGSSNSTFYEGTGSKALGVSSKGSTATPTTLVTNLSTSASPTGAGTSALDVAYNGTNLYYTRNSSAGGVYTPTSNGLGLFTSPTQNFIALSGTAGSWAASNLYTGLTFLGPNQLFVSDTTTDTLDLFTAANPNITTDWDLTSSLSLTGLTSEAVEALAAYSTGPNGADVFFTTNGSITAALSPTGVSSVEEVSWNSTTGFSTPNILQSSTGGVYYTGLAVPEPGTYALFALGLGLIGLMTVRKNARRKMFEI